MKRCLGLPVSQWSGWSWCFSSCREGQCTLDIFHIYRLCEPPTLEYCWILRSSRVTSLTCNTAAWVVSEATSVRKRVPHVSSYNIGEICVYSNEIGSMTCTHTFWTHFRMMMYWSVRWSESDLMNSKLQIHLGKWTGIWILSENQFRSLPAPISLLASILSTET
jgi:hypothetical protein